MSIQFEKIEEIRFTHNYFAERIVEPQHRKVLGEEIIIDGEGWFSNDPAVGSRTGRLLKVGSQLERTHVRSNDNNNNSQDIYIFHPASIKVVSVYDNVGNYYTFAIRDLANVYDAKAITAWLQFIFFKDLVPDSLEGLEVAETLSEKTLGDELEVEGFNHLSWEAGARLKLFFPEKKVSIYSHGPARGIDPQRREMSLEEAQKLFQLEKCQDYPGRMMGMIAPWARERFLQKSGLDKEEFSFLLSP